MKSIKEKNKFNTLSKEELKLLKGGQKNYSDRVKKGKWGFTEKTNPPHD